MDKDKFEKYLEESKETHPLGRVGRPEEVADLILFLASDKALWMTGILLSHSLHIHSLIYHRYPGCHRWRKVEGL